MESMGIPRVQLGGPERHPRKPSLFVRQSLAKFAKHLAPSVTWRGKDGRPGSPSLLRRCWSHSSDPKLELFRFSSICAC